MSSATALLSRLKPANARLLHAEARFFDAYGRGGDHAGRNLVVPLEFFAQPDVSSHLRAWATGRGPLDAERLEAAWRRLTGEAGSAEAFYENLSHFLSLV